MPAAILELESIGMAHGPKFDKVIDDLFQAQLQGKARNPELRLKLLRKLSGIKEPPKKKADEKGKRLAEKPKKKLVGKQPVVSPAPGAPVESQKTAETLARLQAARKGKASAPAPPPAKAPKAKASAARKR